VSLARCSGLQVSVACLDGSVGIDIESRTAVSSHSVSASLLHPTETAELDALPAAVTDARLASLWVAKEALLKATGHGLRVDPRGIRLDIRQVGADHSASVERWPAELQLLAPPRITLFAITDDVVGALAEL
jgi:4'-phosphopantetheinyl transferase